MNAVITQGSPEWFAVRRGKVTASRVADVVAKTKSGVSATRATYMGELIAERLTGSTMERFSNAAMQWGTETEPQARASYEFETVCSVAEIGFVDHPSIAMTGASPDGLIGSSGLVEIKCPNTATHIETLLSGVVPAKYLTQIQWQMACAQCAWCDFVSFDPRLPDEMRIFVKRIQRDSDRILELETAVIEFIQEMDGKIAKLRQKYGISEAA